MNGLHRTAEKNRYDLTADKRRYTQIVQKTNRRDAENAEQDKSFTAKGAEDAKNAKEN
jgi:hypothetical protein